MKQPLGESLTENLHRLLDIWEDAAVGEPGRSARRVLVLVVYTAA